MELLQKPVIIYGCGEMGKSLLHTFGREKIAYYCDRNHAGDYIGGIKILSIDEMCSLPTKENYKVFIAVQDMEARSEIKRKLLEVGFIIPDKEDLYNDCLHVYGTYPDINYEFSNDSPALCRITIGTIPMLIDMFKAYEDEFKGIPVDFWLCYRDSVFRAESARIELGIKKILSYSTVYALRDRVIPIPDYKFKTGLNEVGERGYEQYFQACLDRGEKEYVDKRAFWTGTVNNSESRKALCYIAEMHKERIFCNKQEWNGNRLVKGETIPMIEFPHFKYLIDVRGIGWTDRVKYLLAMKRPLLLVDRPYREYYFDELIPMKHYIPVKEDFSDMLEKIDFLESDSGLYMYIVKNASDFVKEHFNKESVLSAMYNSIMKVCANESSR